MTLACRIVWKTSPGLHEPCFRSPKSVQWYVGSAFSGSDRNSPFLLFSSYFLQHNPSNSVFAARFRDGVVAANGKFGANGHVPWDVVMELIENYSHPEAVIK